jgi:hypothetical protein
MCIVYEVKSDDSIKSIAAQYTANNCPITATEIVNFNGIDVFSMDAFDIGDSFIIPCPGNCCTDSSCSESDAKQAADEAERIGAGLVVEDEAGSQPYKMAVGLLAVAVVGLGIMALLQLRTIRTNAGPSESSSSAATRGPSSSFSASFRWMGGRSFRGAPPPVPPKPQKTLRQSKSWLVQSDGNIGVV